MHLIKQILLPFAAIVIIFSGCTKNEEDDSPNIIGTWCYNDGSGMFVSWSFNSNKTGNEHLVITYNGTTLRDNTLPFTYSQHKNYVNFKNDKKEWTYDVTVSGSHMRLGNSSDGYFELDKQ
jgi:hypothetical protein